MTSYANDTTTTAAAPATTTTANAGAAATAASVGTTTSASAVDATAAQLNKQMSSNNNNNSRYDEDDNNSLDGREKADTTPENIKKIAEIISDKEAAAAAAAAAATPTSPTQRLQQQQKQLHASGFVGLGAAIDESNIKFCLGKPPPSPAEKATVLSRTNHHHQSNSSSGNSNSNNNKDISTADEDESTASNSTTTTTTKQSLAFTIDHFDATENEAAAQAARYKNMMERFQSRHKRGASLSKLETEGNSSKPITEAASAAATPTNETSATPAVKLRVRERSASRVRDASKRHSWSPRSSGSTAATPAEAAPRVPSRTKQLPMQTQPAPPKGTANQLANRTTQFMPRSTAMQMALQQVELLCPHPPLDDVKQRLQEEEDAVSEAGTYTLDGDNYTEEQKDLMNIDRNAAAAAKLRPKQLSVKPSRASNVLEVNYYHETPQQEHKGSSSSATGAYLEQLKSRVQRQQQPLHPQHPQQPQAPPTPPSPRTPAADVGCFTSVTTSGVLAKQRALDTHPKLTRHTHSLSTSQIDSSEYVSNEAKLRHAQAMAASATDRQKAEYRLNVFTTSTTQQNHQHHQLPETPTTPTMTEAALLQSAPTKQDWIQEWARNARARSLAQDVSSSSASRRKQQAQAQAQLMTRSYNCSDTGAGADSLTDDSLSLYSQQQRQFAAATKLNRSLAERYRLLGDCDYASDPALCSHGGQGQVPGGEPYKPPKSPSKIPSPLHTLGRARSASRSSRPAANQEQHQQQQQQTPSSRRSSVKSPAAQCSPQHSLETGYRRSPLHRALMTSSINEAQLQLLTSGEYLLKQLHRRKNSLDDVDDELPATVSPLRRSSSFQQQQRPLQSVRQARPNFQNLYTPPAARHVQQQQQLLQLQQLQLKKSASSNNFEQSYSDYDNELQYYINDEDELGTTGPYYSSGEEELAEEEEQRQQPHVAVDTTVPLSNTRLNKALLMRIERSKQRVAGSASGGSGSGNGHTPAKPSSAPAGKLSVGLVACPNTPELPRRGIKSAPRAASGCGPKLRQSMPRETSLSRLAQQVPSSLANAKKQLLQTANATAREQQRVQPKYLDISKYKSAQSNNFLRKNDAKSTLKPAEQMKRSPSASSMGLSRGESNRASNRSVRSTVSAMNSSTTSLGGGGTRATSAVRRDASMNKQKEAEMVMWKRRSTYDPMKAAAEDRRRKEEARRVQTQTQTQNQIEEQRLLNDEANDVPFESVLRPANNLTITGSINYSPRNSMENDAWMLGESSEFGEYPEDYDEDVEEDDEYVAGQESDDVFEVETADATS
ncbi:uncharacterized protein LOC117788980 [Drosophila innubila]|uniref:uncharacterized protein LOC117788980 n=1 Tax=Drosophila innubila TaxID=198719 RepID=UPI00148C7D95|nr:uncharacterized protein LOC117788980 [Drosophila innubila]XP_034483831.1 uncharacterized protein LOC117788980 [Drosophila innubila]